jgi:hypothetical protein
MFWINLMYFISRIQFAYNSNYIPINLGGDKKLKRNYIWGRMVSSGLLRRVALVRIDVSVASCSLCCS